MSNRSWMRMACACAAAAHAALAGAAPACGQHTGSQDLARLSLEDLMNVKITSASRKEQQVSEVAASVFVITQEDIRRSGMATLPEVFRLVPGMQVAQINSNNWAVTVRGFNSLWANKLLVLIDGRSIYTRTYPGVDWTAQDLMLEDIDRIEVIRGPGASMWGTNAVNGVINIITKSAADTQGTLLAAGAGRIDRYRVALRHGGSAGRLTYRFHSQWADRNGFVDESGTSTHDTWNSLNSGARLDWNSGPNMLTAEAGVDTGRNWALWEGFDGPTPSLSVPRATRPGWRVNPTALVRWTRPLGASALLLQSSTDLRWTDDGLGFSTREAVLDVDGQIHTAVGRRHDLVAGLGFRRGTVSVNSTFYRTLSPDHAEYYTVNAFAQDEVALLPRLRLSVGARVEHDSTDGNTLQPTVRLMARLTPAQHVWAAWSSADRRPSIVDRGLRINFEAFQDDTGLPILMGLTGHPDFKAEHVRSVDAGYRFDLTPSVAFDMSAFRGYYNGLSTLEPQAPVLETTPAPPHLFLALDMANLLDARTTGVEVAAHWTPVANWRLDAGYSALHVSSQRDPTSHDAMAANNDGNAPEAQWELRSSINAGPRLLLDAGVFHVGRVRDLAIPAYTRLDARAELKLSSRLSLAAIAQNLLDDAHVEFGGPNGVTVTRIPRSASITLEWRSK